MKTKDQIEFETVINELREFFDPPAPARPKTADEIVEEELRKLTPGERAAWEVESAVVLAESRARLAKRREASERTQRAQERRAKEFPGDEDREEPGRYRDIADEPQPALTAEDTAAIDRFLGDGPFAPPDPWKGFETWNPEDQGERNEK